MDGQRVMGSLAMYCPHGNTLLQSLMMMLLLMTLSCQVARLWWSHAIWLRLQGAVCWSVHTLSNRCRRVTDGSGRTEQSCWWWCVMFNWLLFVFYLVAIRVDTAFECHVHILTHIPAIFTAVISTEPGLALIAILIWVIDIPDVTTSCLPDTCPVSWVSFWSTSCHLPLLTAEGWIVGCPVSVPVSLE